jgi:hypothetical protein
VAVGTLLLLPRALVEDSGPGEVRADDGCSVGGASLERPLRDREAPEVCRECASVSDEPAKPASCAKATLAWIFARVARGTIGGLATAAAAAARAARLSRSSALVRRLGGGGGGGGGGVGGRGLAISSANTERRLSSSVSTVEVCRADCRRRRDGSRSPIAAAGTIVISRSSPGGTIIE